MSLQSTQLGIKSNGLDQSSCCMRNLDREKTRGVASHVYSGDLSMYGAEHFLPFDSTFKANNK